MCCSEACGKRLAKRIENGMITLEEPLGYFGSIIRADKSALRIRIKQLKHQIKAMKKFWREIPF